MLIDVLGTTYVVKEDTSLKDTPADGLCKSYSKEITYRNAKEMLCKDDPMELKEERKREVIRHELIHAFFFEAGLDGYGGDELLVDWIAKQFPKMLEAMEQAGGI